MALTLPEIWTRARYTAVVVILVVLLLPTALTRPISADEQDETNQAIAREFDVLRTAIDETAGLPPRAKTSLQVKVDAAEIALLLPAVQVAREASRNGAAAVQILTALQQHNHAISDELGYDGDAIDAQAETIKRYVLTNAWPK